jgi:hypothetical protein
MMPAETTSPIETYQPKETCRHPLRSALHVLHQFSLLRDFPAAAFSPASKLRPEEGKQMTKVNVSDAGHQNNYCNESRPEQAETNPLTTEEWSAIRKEAALQIDPETAEVDWCYAQTLDPYGVIPDLPEECWQVGREYFARAPGSDIWVWFGDLPTATESALWKKHRSKLAFPAGLSTKADGTIQVTNLRGVFVTSKSR